MTMRRFMLLLGAALVSIVGAMYLSSLRHLDRDPRGGFLLPALSGDLDSVTDVELRKGPASANLTLHRVGPGHWVVKERSDYPADPAKVRRLLLSLSETKIVEEKTSNPANYPIIGVEDPTGPTPGGVEVALIAPSKKYQVIVGKPAGGGTYVRRAGEGPSFAVEPPLSVDSSARDWIDTGLLNIDADKIQRIRVAVAGGAPYVISRASPAGFTLDSVPRGREANEAQMLAPAPGSFNGVAIDDVAAASGVDFSKPSLCEVTLAGGGIITITGTVAADKHWVTVAATKDDALNARARGRAFELAAYRYEAIFRPIDQLLKPKTTPAKKP